MANVAGTTLRQVLKTKTFRDQSSTQYNTAHTGLYFALLLKEAVSKDEVDLPALLQTVTRPRRDSLLNGKISENSFLSMKGKPNTVAKDFADLGDYVSQAYNASKANATASQNYDQALQNIQDFLFEKNDGRILSLMADDTAWTLSKERENTLKGAFSPMTAQPQPAAPQVTPAVPVTHFAKAPVAQQTTAPAAPAPTATPTPTPTPTVEMPAVTQEEIDKLMDETPTVEMAPVTPEEIAAAQMPINGQSMHSPAMRTKGTSMWALRNEITRLQGTRFHGGMRTSTLEEAQIGLNIAQAFFAGIDGESPDEFRHILSTSSPRKLIRAFAGLGRQAAKFHLQDRANTAQINLGAVEGWMDQAYKNSKKELQNYLGHHQDGARILAILAKGDKNLDKKVRDWLFESDIDTVKAYFAKNPLSKDLTRKHDLGTAVFRPAGQKAKKNKVIENKAVQGQTTAQTQNAQPTAVAQKPESRWSKFFRWGLKAAGTVAGLVVGGVLAGGITLIAASIAAGTAAIGPVGVLMIGFSMVTGAAVGAPLGYKVSDFIGSKIVGRVSNRQARTAAPQAQPVPRQPAVTQQPSATPQPGVQPTVGSRLTSVPPTISAKTAAEFAKKAGLSIGQQGFAKTKAKQILEKMRRENGWKNLSPKEFGKKLYNEIYKKDKHLGNKDVTLTGQAADLAKLTLMYAYEEKTKADQKAAQAQVAKQTVSGEVSPETQKLEAHLKKAVADAVQKAVASKVQVQAAPKPTPVVDRVKNIMDAVRASSSDKGVVSVKPIFEASKDLSQDEAKRLVRELTGYAFDLNGEARTSGSEAQKRTAQTLLQLVNAVADRHHDVPRPEVSFGGEFSQTVSGQTNNVRKIAVEPAVVVIDKADSLGQDVAPETEVQVGAPVSEYDVNRDLHMGPAPVGFGFSSEPQTGSTSAETSEGIAAPDADTSQAEELVAEPLNGHSYNNGKDQSHAGQSSANTIFQTTPDIVTSSLILHELNKDIRDVLSGEKQIPIEKVIQLSNSLEIEEAEILISKLYSKGNQFEKRGLSSQETLQTVIKAGQDLRALALELANLHGVNFCVEGKTSDKSSPNPFGKDKVPYETRTVAPVDDGVTKSEGQTSVSEEDGAQQQPIIQRASASSHTHS